MNDEKMREIEEKMMKIDLSIQSKKELIRELRLKKYFLNQMKNKIEKLEESYSKLIEDDEEKDE